MTKVWPLTPSTGRNLDAYLLRDLARLLRLWSAALDDFLERRGLHLSLLFLRFKEDPLPH